MSDAYFSDIHFKNKMAWVWTTLKKDPKLFVGGVERSNSDGTRRTITDFRLLDREPLPEKV